MVQKPAAAAEPSATRILDISDSDSESDTAPPAKKSKQKEKEKEKPKPVEVDLGYLLAIDIRCGTRMLLQEAGFQDAGEENFSYSSFLYRESKVVAKTLETLKRTDASKRDVSWERVEAKAVVVPEGKGIFSPLRMLEDFSDWWEVEKIVRMWLSSKKKVARVDLTVRYVEIPGESSASAETDGDVPDLMESMPATTPQSREEEAEDGDSD